MSEALPDDSKTDPEPPGMTRSRRSRLRRFGCLGSVALFVLLVVYSLVDVPAPDDSDLLPPPEPTVAFEDSILGGIVELCGSIPEEEIPERGSWVDEFWTIEIPDPFAPRPLDRSFWTEEHATRIEIWFDGPGAPLADLPAVLARPTLGESVPEDLSAVLRGLPEMRQALFLERDRAFALRIRGKTGEASRRLHLGIELGEVLLDQGRSFVAVLLGIACSQVGHDGLVSVLHDGDLAPEVESRLLEAAMSPRRAERAARAYRHEYVTFRGTVEKLAAGELDVEEVEEVSAFRLRLTFKPHRTLNRAAGHFRALVERARTPRWRREPSDPTRYTEGATLRAILTVNAGEILIGQLLPNVAWAIGRFDRCAVEQKAVGTLVALRIHERTHGTLPPDLGTLIETVGGFEAVPIDDYSGEPLRYDPDRRIIWSIGENGTDEGAADLDAWREDLMNRFEYTDWIWFIPPVPDEDGDR